ncbi:hypothetical protein M5K25_002521 [Dendrobium thyrsiflorum]|uniref:Uncharacterized protein n=1 Tax=Dendrobium thyrsiflorum TaxID=117978 RepID=A0ABD0VMM9_DENTH
MVAPGKDLSRLLRSSSLLLGGSKGIFISIKSRFSACFRRNQKELDFLPASGGSKRSQDSLPYLGWWKEFCKSFSILLWEQKESHYFVFSAIPGGEAPGSRCRILMPIWNGTNYGLFRLQTLFKNLKLEITLVAWFAGFGEGSHYFSGIRRVVPAARKFRFNGIPPELEEKLEIMFSRIVATGDNVWIPNSGILPSELRTEQHNSSEEDDLHDDDPQVEISNGEEATFTTASQRFQSSATFVKGKRAKTVKLTGKQLFVNHIESLVNAAQSVSSSIAMSSTPRRTVTILDAVTEISGIPEIYDDLEFYEFAIEFLKDKDSRESFMGMPSAIEMNELRDNIAMQLYNFCRCANEM